MVLLQLPLSFRGFVYHVITDRYLKIQTSSRRFLTCLLKVKSQLSPLFPDILSSWFGGEGDVDISRIHQRKGFRNYDIRSHDITNNRIDCERKESVDDLVAAFLHH